MSASAPLGRLLARRLHRASKNQYSQPFPSSPQAPPLEAGFCGPNGLGVAAAFSFYSDRVATGYCVKCKASREILDPHQITMKNGRPATEGRCPVCGTRVFKIGALAPAEPAERGEEPAGPEAAGRP